MLKKYLDLLDKAVCTVNVVNEHDIEKTTDFICQRLRKFNKPYDRTEVKQIVTDQHKQPPHKSYAPIRTMFIPIK